MGTRRTPLGGANEHSPHHPTLVGKYRLLERLNVADHVEVYRAKAVGIEGFERTVMVKRIPPGLMEDPESVGTFIENAKIAVHLQHENLAQILDLGMVDGAYFVALEFIGGRDLRTILEAVRARGQVMPAPLACYTIMQLCECLDYVHNQRDGSGRELGLVRRALCPQDVMVGYEGEVKLIDVGVVPAGGKPSRTHPGMGHGAFGYLSPEQVRGLPVDHRSDIFVLGIMLYEMLTGERLFAEENDFATLEDVRDARIAPPTSRNPGIPPELERIVLRALARDATDRYPTAFALRSDLEGFLHATGQFPARNDLAAWMKLTFADEQEIDEQGLEWDEEEKDTEAFEEQPSFPRAPANTNGFLSDADAETIPSTPQSLLLDRAGESAKTPIAHSALRPSEGATTPAEAWPRLEELRRKLGRPAETLSLPVPSPVLQDSSHDRLAVPPQLPLSDPLPQPGAADSAAFQTPFPGTPILPQPQPLLAPASLGAPAPRGGPNPLLKYSVLFALLLLAGGVVGYLLVPRSGMLQISVKPADASLALDGVPVSSGPPFRLKRSAGVHRLTISRPGYDTIVQDIWIDARQRGQLDIALKPSPSTGFQLTSTPSNAPVWLDGRPLIIDKAGKQATTALTASRLSPGPHVVEIKGGSQYEPWVHRFVQEPGRTVHLHADLVPVRGLGRARGSSPAARTEEPTLGSSTGKTYDKGKKRSSRSPRTVRQASLAGDPFERQTRGAPSKQAQSGLLSEEDIFETYGRQEGAAAGRCPATISSRPWAEVSIDGKPTGKLTPLVNYSLPCGKHRVSFKNQDLMIERNESITLVPGRPFKKIFMLVETDPWPGSSRAR